MKMELYQLLLFVHARPHVRFIWPTPMGRIQSFTVFSSAAMSSRRAGGRAAPSAASAGGLLAASAYTRHTAAAASRRRPGSAGTQGIVGFEERSRPLGLGEA